MSGPQRGAAWRSGRIASDLQSLRNKAMKPDNLLASRRKLLKRREMLAGDVSHMTDAIRRGPNGSASGDLSIMPYHMADVASDAFEQELTLGLIENEEDELLAIDDALEKVRDGTYGECEECGRQISIARLRAIPYASLCIRCKRLEEEALRRRHGFRCNPAYGFI